MDGYAVRSADLSSGVAELAVLEEVTAGARAALQGRPPGPASRS